MSTLLAIGGGVGGVSAIVGFRSFNKTAEIVLVEPKEYAELVWGAYRAPFDESVAKGSLCPLDRLCEKHNVKHLRQLVVSLTEDKAELDNGETIDFDVCVVATGATTKWPGLGRGPPHSYGAKDGSIEGRLKQFKAEGERILSAASVLLVGGGLIGSELAGDVAAKLAGKDIDITLVHSGEHLCPEMDKGAAAMVKEQLEGHGVRVILNERATQQQEQGKWTLSTSGETIEAEEVIMTVGMSACNDFIKCENKAALNAQGWVDTDDYFCVKGSGGKIFSIGDCCTTLPNNAKDIMQNIKIIGHNVNETLKTIESNEPVDSIKSLKKMELGPPVYVATTGPRSGVMHSPYFNTKYIVPWFKNWTMFFFRARMELGLQSVE